MYRFRRNKIPVPLIVLNGIAFFLHGGLFRVSCFVFRGPSLARRNGLSGGRGYLLCRSFFEESLEISGIGSVILARSISSV